VDSADVGVAVDPQRPAEATARHHGPEVRLDEIRLVVAGEINPLAAHGAEAPDKRLDATAGAREQAGRGRGKLRAGGVLNQVVQRWLVVVGDVEIAGSQNEEAGRDREVSRAHGQNPAWMEKKNCREGGYGPRSMLRVTA